MFGHASPMREDEAPEGLIVHSAGQGEQGYYVYDIWESREAFERFMEEKLGPALGEVMGGPPPEGGAPQYFAIDVLIMLHLAPTHGDRPHHSSFSVVHYASISYLS